MCVYVCVCVCVCSLMRPLPGVSVSARGYGSCTEVSGNIPCLPESFPGLFLVYLNASRCVCVCVCVCVCGVCVCVCVCVWARERTEKEGKDERLRESEKCLDVHRTKG